MDWAQVTLAFEDGVCIVILTILLFSLPVVSSGHPISWILFFMSALRLSLSLSSFDFFHTVAILEIPTVEYATGPNMYNVRSKNPGVGHAPLRHNIVARPLLRPDLDSESDSDPKLMPVDCVAVGCREKYCAGPSDNCPIADGPAIVYCPCKPPSHQVQAEHPPISHDIDPFISSGRRRQPRPPCLLFLLLFLQRKAPSRRARSRRSPPSHPIPPRTRAIPPTRNTIPWFYIS